MVGQEDFDEEDTGRRFTGPYTSKHPVPTVQKYREQKHDDDTQKQAEEAQASQEDEGKVKRAFGAVKRVFNDEDSRNDGPDPYPTANRNAQNQQTPEQQEGGESTNKPQPPPKDEKTTGDRPSAQSRSSQKSSERPGPAEKSATESAAGRLDPREKRKDMKHMERDTGGREVTDPVTHLPIVIRDSTSRDLKHAPENEAPPGTYSETQTGFGGANKSRSQLQKDENRLQKDYEAMNKMFPPPAFDDAKAELARTYQLALTIGLASIGTFALLILVMLQLFSLRKPSNISQGSRWSDTSAQPRSVRIFVPVSITVVLSALVGTALISGIRGWLGKKVREIWEEEVWDLARQQEVKDSESDTRVPESVAWLNSLVAAVWPLINPDLFTSLADTLEDVMQASLPKLVRMVSVDDIGQGSEAIRILGIRWLPTGAASQSVDEKGNLLSPKKSQEDDSDRNAPDDGQIVGGSDLENDQEDQQDGQNKKVSQQDRKKQKENEQEKEAVREGMEAEQGDFVNMELAFAYRARTTGKSMKAKARNAHLYLKFYLPGSVAVPVWVELRGIIGTMRLRLQLGPDPPFFNLCTLTFLGQPKADLSCIPLSKHNLNVMDVPLISGFVQSAIDAALSEYVAPKSLTLDLKDMLVGDDFKKDTHARGVLAVFIKSARGFKEGDGGVGPTSGSSDAYVSISWGKFGKPMASTRIIVDEQEPRWDEWTYLLVGPEELNAEETLRLQLWDSDKYTADDDLGRVGVPLKELMSSSTTRNRLCDREDRFKGENPHEEMPGNLSWSVGYFSKSHITDEQLAHQTEDGDIRTKDDLKRKASETAQHKLREATIKDEGRELQQQEIQDFKEHEDSLMISSPPDEAYPSGIFSIQVHNITGLEIERLRKRHGRGKAKAGESEEKGENAEEDDLPSSYCNIILNHQKIYRTRTKPKNAKPFFNAGTERFIKDYRTAEVIVSVRDARDGESDALLGVVYLPLRKVFETRCQVNEIYPIAGGIGFGRARLSMVWRATELHVPAELSGWDLGTLEIKTPVRAKGGLPDELKQMRLKLRSNIARGKLQSDRKSEGWGPKHSDKSAVFIAVRNRYACPLIVEFRKSVVGPDKTSAFSVFWLKDIPDEEEKNITLKVWKGTKEAFKRARSCYDFDGFVGEHQHNNEATRAEEVGEIELTLKFWRGLSGWHKKWAQKHSRGTGTHDIVGVMEVLDVVSDIEREPGQEGDEDGSGNESDSDNSSDDENEGSGVEQDHRKLKETLKGGGIKSAVKSVLDSHNDPDDGSRGAIAQLRDYKDHHESLHRRHRGVMQWRAARKLNWLTREAKQAKGRVEGVFEHNADGKEPGIETEV